MRTKLFNATKIVVLSLLLSFGLSYAYAWTAPMVQAPNGNVAAPINTSLTTQTKSGDLLLRTLLPDTVSIGGTINVNAITAPNFCIGTTCINAWSTGTVTSLSSGTGITLSPNPITTTGTITNSGVTSYNGNTGVVTGVASITGGVCAVGQVVTKIDANGVATCGAGISSYNNLPTGSLVGYCVAYPPYNGATTHNEPAYNGISDRECLCRAGFTLKQTGIAENPTYWTGGSFVATQFWSCIKN